MASEPETYLAVLKASYDYEPQPDSEDELAIKENQLLFLLERVDDEYVANRTTPSPPVPNLLTLILVGGRSRSSLIPKMKRLPLAWCRPPMSNQ